MKSIDLCSIGVVAEISKNLKTLAKKNYLHGLIPVEVSDKICFLSFGWTDPLVSQGAKHLNLLSLSL